MVIQITPAACKTTFEVRRILAAIHSEVREAIFDNHQDAIFCADFLKKGTGYDYKVVEIREKILHDTSK